MSVEKINNKVDEFYSVNTHDSNILNELDPSSENSYKSDLKESIQAEKIAINVSKKNISENSKSHGENSSEVSQDQLLKGVGQKQVKKGELVIEFFGSLVKGVFGSSKKQEKELRQLEHEVQLLNEQTHGLSSKIKNTMVDSMAIQSDAMTTEHFQNDVMRSNDANRENEQIDDLAKLRMKKDEKLARISELKKKGVK